MSKGGMAKNTTAYMYGGAVTKPKKYGTINNLSRNR